MSLQAFVSERRQAGVIGLLAFGAILGMALFVPTSLWLPLVWVISGGALLLFWIGHVAEPGDRPALFAGVLVGLLLRAVLAWFVVDHLYRFSDTRMYWYLGTRLADMWTMPGIKEVDLVRATGTTSSGYYLWTALHVLIKRDQLLTALSNAIIGSGSGVLVYLIGKMLWGRRVGVIGAWLLWTSSAFILVDGHSLRDTIATFCGLSVVYGTCQLQERWSIRSLAWFLVGFAVLLQIRLYMAALLVPVTFATLLIAARTHRLVLLLFVVGVGVTAGIVVAESDLAILLIKLRSGHILADMLKFAHFGLVGASQSPESATAGVRIQSVGDMVLHIPFGLVRFLFAPLPWMAMNLDRLFIPDGIVRYATLPVFFIGVVEGTRHEWQRALAVALVLTAGMVLYALIELGGNVRHNAQFFPYQYLFIAVGWSAASRYKEALWAGYALVSLTLWIYGMTLSLSFLFFPAVFAVLAVWWGTYVAFIDRRGRDTSG